MRWPTQKSRRLSKKFADRVTQALRQGGRSEPSKPLKVLAFDEARFGLINWHRRRYCPKGFRPPYIVRRSYKWTYLYAAVEPTTGESFCLYLPGMDSRCLQSFLEEISKAYSENHLLVVLDGAPSHRSEQISVPRERRLCASSGLLSRARPGREMVPRVQRRVVQQSLRDSRVSARGAGPGTLTLLGGYCSTPTAHWFLLVGGGCRCVMISITRIGVSYSVGDSFSCEDLCYACIFRGGVRESR